jgi:predicted DCC family thiol-disulfide oxidoreductase YuxK
MDAPLELPGSVLLYDDTCGLCAASVRFILGHERQHSLFFASLQGGLGAELRRRHPELREVDSMVWVEPSAAGPERVLVRSGAAFRVANYLGGFWRLAALGKLLPASLRDRAYDWIARHRHSLIRAGTQCLLPSPELRSRFLDVESRRRSPDDHRPALL